MGKQGAQEVAQTHRLRGRRRAAGLRRRHRQADGGEVGAAQPAVGVPRGERRRGQRLRLPGGFIYVTRGLLAHMNSEAELATVLGHEVGHVTARHSVQQISKAQLATLGLGLGSIALLRRGPVRRARQPGARGAVPQVRAGRREPGRPARLQVRPRAQLRRAGDGQRLPDPQPRQSGGRRRGAAAGVALHPPEPREPGRANTQERLDTLQASLDNTVVGRDEFLQQIDGLTFGEDPRQGFFEGSTFYHPDMRFQLQFPDGVEGAEHAVGRRRGEPEGRRDGPARPGRQRRRPARPRRSFCPSRACRRGTAAPSRINGNQAATSYFQAQTRAGGAGGDRLVHRLRRDAPTR